MRGQSSAATRSATRARRRSTARSGAGGRRSRRRLALEQGALALHAPAIARRARRRCAPRDGREWRRRSRSRRTPAPPRARPSARRSARRSRCSSPSRPRGISRSACQTRCWKAVPRTSSGRSRPTRGRLDEADHPGHQRARSRGRRRPAGPWGSDPEDRAPGRRDRRRAGSRRRPCRWPRRGSSPASTRRRRSGSTAPSPPARKSLGVMPSTVGGGRVEAAARVEARAVDRVGHRLAARQLVAHPPRAVGRRVGLRRDAGDRLEDPVEVEAAHARGSGQRVEARRLLGRLDQPAGLRHGRGVLARRAPRSSGRQRLQGRKPARLRLLARRVEAHVLAPRPPRRAGRPAIHAGRPDRVVEDPVGAPVAPHHGRPPLVVAGERRRLLLVASSSPWLMIGLLSAFGAPRGPASPDRHGACAGAHSASCSRIRSASRHRPPGRRSMVDSPAGGPTMTDDRG